MIPQLEEIKRILHIDWDPIGVSAFPEALDEYDCYAFDVFVMLQKGADAEAISEYLDWVVTVRMGLSARGDSADIAKKIISSRS